MEYEANDDGDGSGQGRAWLTHLAHDLRGPLSPLAMAVSLLQTGRAGPAQQPELYALMQRQIDRLTQLLDDTADLLVLRPRPAQAVDLASLLDMLKARLARRLRSAEAAVDFAAPAAPCFVSGEMRDLLRLVGELALRCAELGERGGVVRFAIGGGKVPELRMWLDAGDAVADMSARCAAIVEVLNGVSHAHVADAMSAAVLRRYGIDLSAAEDGAGFSLRFRPA